MAEWELRSTYVKPEAAITVFELLMMSGVSLETCRAIKKHWNNKFYYTVASCWLFLYDMKRSVVAVIQVSHHLPFAAGSKPCAVICKLSCFMEENELRAFENNGRDRSGNVLD